MSIRQLKSGDHIPEGEPKRYPSQRGYIRLRWRVGTNTYVEVYEHRVVDGVVTDAEEIHHLNHDKADNRPENLAALTKVDHAKLHGAEMERKYWPYKSAYARAKSERAAERRMKRAELTAEMRKLYEAGMSTTEIGARYGIDASGVSRRLRQGGTNMRPRNGAKDTGPTLTTRQAVHARSRMRCERCGRDLTWVGGEIHHRLNRSQGIDNSPSNLVHLCKECHLWATESPQAAWEEGFHVRPWESPRDVPVLYRGQMRALNDVGGFGQVRDVG